jgi:hypothetical protein
MQLVTWLVGWLVGWLVRSFVRSLVCGLVGWLVYGVVCKQRLCVVWILVLESYGVSARYTNPENGRWCASFHLYCLRLRHVSRFVS